MMCKKSILTVLIIVTGLCLGGSAYGAPQAGLVTKVAEMAGYDFAIVDRLESLGYEVTIIDSADVKNGVFSVEDAEAMDVIVVSEVIGSSDAIPLNVAKVPMMNGEGYGWHKMNYAEADGSASWQNVNDPNGNLVTIIDDSHPIVVNAGLTAGPIAYLQNEGATATTAAVSSLTPSASNIASIMINDIEYAIIFAIDEGMPLAKDPNLMAPARIVGFTLPGNQDPDLSDDGWALFDAAIRWLTAPQAGLVTKAAEMAGYDYAIVDRLESLGYEVTIIDSGDVKNGVFTVADAEAMDVIVVSEVIGSSDAIPLNVAKVPMMNGEGYGWHKMNYAEADGSASWQNVNDPNGNLVTIIDDSHPIVVDAGLTAGPIAYLQNEGATATTAAVSSLTPSAANIASIMINDIEYAIIFAIDEGMPLAKDPNLMAPARIVGFSLPGNQDPNLSDEGWALFDAAIRWLDPAPVSIPAMVAHWPMDDGAGTVVTDSVGGNDGEMVGLDPLVAWITDGALDGAVRFDGTDGHNIVVPHSAELDFSDVDFSISLFVRYPISPAGLEHRWIIKGTFGAPGTGSRYEIFHKSDKVRFEIDNGPVNAKSSLQVDDTPFGTGEWVHVVAVRDAANDELAIYADGILQGTATDTSGDISNGEGMRIGASTNDDSTMLGDIDDVRIFPSALTEAEIAAIY